MKSNKNGFCQFTRSRMNMGEGVGLLLNVSEGMVMKGMDKAGVLNIFFVFGGPISLR